MLNKFICYFICLFLVLGGELNGENYDIILIFILDINNYNYDGQNNYFKNYLLFGNFNNYFFEKG